MGKIPVPCQRLTVDKGGDSFASCLPQMTGKEPTQRHKEMPFISKDGRKGRKKDFPKSRSSMGMIQDVETVKEKSSTKEVGNRGSASVKLGPDQIC